MARNGATDRHFMLVVPRPGGFEIGLANGVLPWTPMGDFESLEEANRISTILAMHFHVRVRPVNPNEVMSSP